MTDDPTPDPQEHGDETVPTTDDDSPGDPDLETEVRAAIDEVRREGLKAAALPAVLDAAVVFLVANLLLVLTTGGELPDAIAGPLPGQASLALIAGLVVGGLELVWRTRQPAVERFEDANSDVSEALRTARDAVESDRDGRMVRALYADVLDRLADTSSRDLVAWRRLTVTVLVLVAVSGATVGVSATGLSLDADGGDDRTAVASVGNNATPTAVENDSTLHDPDEVLGDPTDVSAGDNNLSAEVEASTGGQGNEDPEDYDRSGYADDDGSGVSAQRAGYADTETVEEADLIRQFTLALEDDED